MCLVCVPSRGLVDMGFVQVALLIDAGTHSYGREIVIEASLRRTFRTPLYRERLVRLNCPLQIRAKKRTDNRTKIAIVRFVRLKSVLNQWFPDLEYHPGHLGLVRLKNQPDKPDIFVLSGLSVVKRLGLTPTSNGSAAIDT
jgi:hypothetical protein